MSLIKWRERSSSPIVGSFFDNFFRDDDGFWPANFRGSTVPAINISEDEKSFTVEVAAPGKTREDFNVSIDSNVLVISSEKEEKNEEDEKNWRKKEYNYHSFQRSMWIPENVDAEKITATYQDGILAVVLPKNEMTVKKAKAIEVK